jgi:hypothetical protein
MGYLLHRVDVATTRLFPHQSWTDHPRKGDRKPKVYASFSCRKGTTYYVVSRLPTINREAAGFAV